MSKLSYMTKVKEKTNLILGFHGHIPPESAKVSHENNLLEGNCNFVIQLIEVLSNLKNLKTFFHFSSNSISYLDKKYSDFSGKIRNLLDQNQLELLSGGMYEPIFPFIPKEDRQAQISLMNRLINHTYGYIPHGAWITEHSWEPTIALDLAKSRIQYTCLPKEYFQSAGLDEKELSGYFITEDEGRKIAVFPISLSLNTLMEQYSEEEAVNIITSTQSKDVLSSEESVIISVYEITDSEPSKILWIKNFLEILDSQAESIETKLLNTYYQKNKPKGRIYLPGKQEIQTQIKQQAKKGKWKHSLLKYPEANLLHKKMLRVSKKVNSAKEGKSRFKVIKEMINQAYDLLLMGQSNDSYWDTFLGGIYSPQKRHNTYSNLIKAESLIDTASRQNSKWIQVSEIDYDCDGHDEIIIETETQNIYISPALGGSILEYDFRPKNINITNTISRKEEEYHSNGKLTYDKYTKLNIIDHFLENNLDLDKVVSNQLNHLTEKTLNPYNIEKIKAKEETCKIALELKTSLTKLNNNPEIELKKQISTKSGDSSLTVDYLLTNKSTDKIDFTFAVEFNFNIAQGYDEKSCFYLDNNKENKTPDPSLSSSESLKEINQISLYSNPYKLNLSLAWNKHCTLFRYPIETISYNHRKLEKIYQGSTIFLTWTLSLEPNIPWELSIKQDISSNPDEL